MRNILDAKFLNDVAEEIDRARKKFPINTHMHAALAEEAGEVANALLERGYRRDQTELLEQLDHNVWKECVQTAAMALRVAVDTDPSFEYKPPDFFPGIGK